MGFEVDLFSLLVGNVVPLKATRPTGVQNAGEELAALPFLLTLLQTLTPALEPVVPERLGEEPFRPSHPPSASVGGHPFTRPPNAEGRLLPHPPTADSQPAGSVQRPTQYAALGAQGAARIPQPPTGAVPGAQEAARTPQPPTYAALGAQGALRISQPATDDPPTANRHPQSVDRHPLIRYSSTHPLWRGQFADGHPLIRYGEANPLTTHPLHQNRSAEGYPLTVPSLPGNPVAIEGERTLEDGRRLPIEFSSPQPDPILVPQPGAASAGDHTASRILLDARTRYRAEFHTSPDGDLLFTPSLTTDRGPLTRSPITDGQPTGADRRSTTNDRRPTQYAAPNARDTARISQPATDDPPTANRHPQSVDRDPLIRYSSTHPLRRGQFADGHPLIRYAEMASPSVAAEPPVPGAAPFPQADGTTGAEGTRGESDASVREHPTADGPEVERQRPVADGRLSTSSGSEAGDVAYVGEFDAGVGLRSRPDGEGGSRAVLRRSFVSDEPRRHERFVSENPVDRAPHSLLDERSATTGVEMGFRKSSPTPSQANPEGNRLAADGGQRHGSSQFTSPVRETQVPEPERQLPRAQQEDVGAAKPPLPPLASEGRPTLRAAPQKPGHPQDERGAAQKLEVTVTDERKPLGESRSVRHAEPLSNRGHGVPTWHRPDGTNGEGMGTSAEVVHLASLPAQVAEHLSRAAQAGRTVLRLRLHPPELGHLQIRLHLKGDTLHVHIETPDPAVKELIETQMELLHAALEGRGFHLEQLSVVLPQVLPGTGDSWLSRRSGGQEPGQHTSTHRSSVPAGVDGEPQAVEGIEDMLDRHTGIDYHA